MNDQTAHNQTSHDETTNGRLRVGIMVPTGVNQWGQGTDPRALIDFAVRAERLGYASLWVNDSLLTPRIEALTMLAALAPVTERITLGTAALLPVLRRPILAAQSIASLDLLSGGRLIVAVGGAFPGRFGQPLHTLSEVPWPRRFARLDETVRLWRQLWRSDGPTSFHGEILHFDEIPPGTQPAQPGGPPIWLAGATPTALARTGRLYDGWLPYPPDPADYATGLAQARVAARESGRDPEELSPALMVTMAVVDDQESGRVLLDQYSRSNYGVPLEMLETIQALAAGPAEYLIEWLGRYVEAGARQIVVRLGALDLAGQIEQLERIAELCAALK